jgi:hypothetical protein
VGDGDDSVGCGVAALSEAAVPGVPSEHPDASRPAQAKMVTVVVLSRRTVTDPLGRLSNPIVRTVGITGPSLGTLPPGTTR